MISTFLTIRTCHAQISRIVYMGGYLFCGGIGQVFRAFPRRIRPAGTAPML
jgi:hypothetical protein